MDKLKQFAQFLNQQGIPLPMIRDPKTQLPSVSLTMMVASFTVVLLGLVGKLSSLLGDINLTEALTLLGITSSLYFGRKFQTGSISTDTSSNPTPPSES